MDDRKDVPRIRKRSAMSTSRPPLFDPMRFVEPQAGSKSRGTAKTRDANSNGSSHGLKSRATLIAELAYFRALDRGFQPGYEVDDWLAAEAEVDRRKRPDSDH
jgi:hypothetical protein